MYYPSIHYPYNSPYHGLVPYPLSVRQRIAELQTLDNYTKLAESEAIVKSNEQAIAKQNYTRSLLINTKIESNLYQKMYGNTVDQIKFNVAQSSVEYNYLKKLQELRRQRQMLERAGKINLYPNLVQQTLKNHDERYLSDDELVNYYQSGARGQDYHYEMYRQLQNKQKLPQNDHSKIDQLYKTDRIYNKKQSANKKQQEQKGQIIINNQTKKAEQIQRSYVDALNQSSTYRYENVYDSTAEKAIKQFDRGATIDVVKHQKDDPSLANTFYCSPKKKRFDNTLNKTAVLDSSKSNKTKTKGRKKIKNTFTKPYTISFNSAITESALQKINNRLKVSAIVYKDSKLRHAKHEVQHLFNTFENELKGRKEVKDKINNNPSVLKKHNMVVPSR